MGDGKRFEVFAKYIANNFPPQKYKAVADIAGGKGALQVELHSLGYSVTTYDKRHTKCSRNLQYKYSYFNSDIKENYSLLVGMHPDEATDVIIVQAIQRCIPFCVVPCCILPCATKYNGNNDRASRGAYRSWVNHLKQVAESAHYDVAISELPISGKNIVLSGKPKSRKGGLACPIK